MARTHRVCLVPREPAATGDHEPTRRAEAPRSCSVRVSIFTPFDPSVERARKEEGENQARSIRSGITPPGRWGNSPEQHAGPAVKTSNPRLSPRGAYTPSVAIRAWGENPGRRASSVTTVLAFRPFA